MANTHYIFTFTNDIGEDWSVMFLNKAYYTSEVFTILKTDASGFALSYEGNTDGDYQPIIPSTFSANLFLDANSRDLVAEIIASEQYNFTVCVFNGSSLFWRGTILQDGMELPDQANNSNGYIKIVATDGFGVLQDIAYNGFDVNDLQKHSVNYYIWKCLLNVADSSTINYIYPLETRLFTSASLWYEAAMDSSVVTDDNLADPLENTLIDEAAFIEVDEYGVATGLSLYDILTNVLSVFNLQISQCKGTFLVIQKNTYEQTTTRGWNYGYNGLVIDTVTLQLRQDLPDRFTGSIFGYILPIGEISATYDFKQGIFKNNLFPYDVVRGTTYPLGKSNADATINFSGTIETKFTGSGGTLANIVAVYYLTIRNGTHYLKEVDGNYEWSTTATDYVTVKTGSFKSDYTIEQVRLTNFAFSAILPEEGEDISFLWEFLEYRYLTTDLPWSDIGNTNSATHENIPGSFNANTNTGIPQDGTMLYKATVSGISTTKIELETLVIGDGANTYSAGAMSVLNGGTQTKSDAWTTYAGIGTTGIKVHQLRCKELIAQRRHTVTRYTANFYGAMDFHKAFVFGSKVWVFNSMEWDCSNAVYTGIVEAIEPVRTSITLPTPLLAVSDSGGGGVSGGGSSGGVTAELWQDKDGYLQPVTTDKQVKVTTTITDEHAIVGISESGAGLYGSTTSGIAIYGEATDATAVYGYSTNGTGVYGQSYENDAVYGSSTNGSGVNAYSVNAAAINAYSDNGKGVWANATNDVGVSGGSPIVGVYGVSTVGYGVQGYSVDGVGVYGNSDTSTGVVGESISGAAARFGSTTNNTTIENDGTIKFNGAASIWCDIDFPIVVRTTGAGIPTMGTFNGNLTMPIWAVNDFNMCESQEFIHGWKEGSTCYFHLHIDTNGLDTTNRYVKFEIEYGYSSAGAWTFPAVVTTADILIPANTANRTQIIMNLFTFTPTNSKIGDHVLARLKRVAATGTAPTNNPFIPMLQMHVECDTVGSRSTSLK